MKFGTSRVFFFKSVKEIQVLLKLTKIIKTLHEDVWTFMTISRSVHLTLRNVSKSAKKIKRENQNTHFIFVKFFPENRVFYDITWENVVQPDKRQIKIQGWAKAGLQLWVRERQSLLLYYYLFLPYCIIYLYYLSSYFVLLLLFHISLLMIYLLGNNGL